MSIRGSPRLLLPSWSAQDGPMPWLVFLALALMLTGVTLGNAAQSNINPKKPPVKVTRNPSNRESNGAKPSSPTARPPTAIDPLSHVRLPYLLIFVYGCYIVIHKQVLAYYINSDILIHCTAYPQTNEYCRHNPSKTSKSCCAGKLGAGCREPRKH
jgi:hypothetical protein